MYKHELRFDSGIVHMNSPLHGSIVSQSQTEGKFQAWDSPRPKTTISKVCSVWTSNQRRWNSLTGPELYHGTQTHHSPAPESSQKTLSDLNLVCRPHTCCPDQQALWLVCLFALTVPLTLHPFIDTVSTITASTDGDCTHSAHKTSSSSVLGVWFDWMQLKDPFALYGALQQIL